MVSSRLITRLTSQLGSATTWRRLLASKASSTDGGSGEKQQDGGRFQKKSNSEPFEPTKVRLRGDGLKTSLDARAELAEEFARDAIDRVSAPMKRDINFPYYTDVVIIGGGAIGSSIAYNMKNMHTKLNIVVVERDPTVSAYCPIEFDGNHASVIKVALSQRR